MEFIPLKMVFLKYFNTDEAILLSWLDYRLFSNDSINVDTVLLGSMLMNKNINNTIKSIDKKWMIRVEELSDKKFTIHKII